jgi:hypothetical protein
MHDEAAKKSTIELLRELPRTPGVCFDPQEIALEGIYLDELSAYRARRLWTSVLEETFLLEVEHDFRLSVAGAADKERFLLRCEFSTACGRYAFWRLTHNQAPEAQYLIETAHIPQTESRHKDFLEAPDLRAVEYRPSILEPGHSPRRSDIPRRLSWLRELVSRIAHRKSLE